MNLFLVYSSSFETWIVLPGHRNQHLCLQTKALFRETLVQHSSRNLYSRLPHNFPNYIKFCWNVLSGLPRSSLSSIIYQENNTFPVGEIYNYDVIRHSCSAVLHPVISICSELFINLYEISFRSITVLISNNNLQNNTRIHTRWDKSWAADCYPTSFAICKIINRFQSPQFCSHNIYFSKSRHVIKAINVSICDTYSCNYARQQYYLLTSMHECSFFNM